MSNKSGSRILFVHQQKHIGGGQIYVDELIAQFRKDGFITELIENISGWKLLLKLLLMRTDYVIWSVYAEFSPLYYLLVLVKGSKNVTIIYGIWALESRSLIWKKLSLKKRIRQLLYEIKIWSNQFSLCLLSTHIVHLSQYAQFLFYATPLFPIFRRKRQCIIFGGANSTRFVPIEKKQRKMLRKQMGIGETDRILLMVGRTEQRKNYIDGLRTLRLLRQKKSSLNYFLYIVVSHGIHNDYEYFDYFMDSVSKLKLSSYVRIISGVQHEQLAAWYQVADAYLMLSKELETFGLVTLEALSCGCPVFGYNACATKEIITYKQQAFLYPLGRYDKIACALENYVILSEKKKGLLRHNIKQSSLQFSWDRAFFSLKDIL